MSEKNNEIGINNLINRIKKISDKVIREHGDYKIPWKKTIDNLISKMRKKKILTKNKHSITILDKEIIAYYSKRLKSKFKK